MTKIKATKLKTLDRICLFVAWSEFPADTGRFVPGVAFEVCGASVEVSPIVVVAGMSVK